MTYCASLAAAWFVAIGADAFCSSSIPLGLKDGINMTSDKPFKFKWKIFVAGLASIVLGYVLLAGSDITYAPILLVLGYCILVPLSFL
jgi:hypothetical protein